MLNLNTEKCKVVSFGRSVDKSYIYSVCDDNNHMIPLESGNEVVDLGVCFDEKVSFREHIHAKINKAYMTLGIIRPGSRPQKSTPVDLCASSRVGSLYSAVKSDLSGAVGFMSSRLETDLILFFVIVIRLFFHAPSLIHWLSHLQTETDKRCPCSIQRNIPLLNISIFSASLLSKSKNRRADVTLFAYVIWKMSRQGNTNVTTSAISRSEKVLISELLVINETDALKKTVSRQNASFVWRYFGALHRTSTSESELSDGSTLIDGERLYCRCVNLSFILQSFSA